MPLGGGLTIAAGGAQIVKGIADFFGAKSAEKKAEEERSRLKIPFYKIQDEYIQNRNIAASEAAGGLGDETKNYYTTEAQRGLGTTLNSVNMSGGSPNDAGKLLDIYSRNINRVAAEDASQKVKNIQTFFDANKELAGQKTMQWTLNEYRPYERKLKEITERISAAKTNKNNAINSAIGGLSSLGTSVSNSNLLSSLLSNNQPAQESGQIIADVAPISSADVRPEGTTQTIDGSALPQVNNNPMINPYGNGNGYWDGTKWVSAASLINVIQ